MTARHRPAVLAFLALLASGPAIAFDAGAPEGAERTAKRLRPFDRYALPVAPFDGSGDGTREVSGRVAMSAFRLDERNATVADVMEGYRARIAEAGFATLLDCATESCGGFDFRFGVTLLPPPRMLIDAADFAQLSAERRADGTVVSVLASRVLGAVHVQTVTVTPAEAETEITEAPAPAPGLLDETLILPQDARSLLATLKADGHVRVEGLVFKTGGAVLSDGSEEALEMLARLLARDETLRVAIVGHSDNTGSLDTNVTRAALIDRGVPPGQMESHGVGWLAPVTSNDTEAGRARNRRVELVLR